ncbi:MAG: hypothetical protein AMJ92_03370 [candidate division Zixibacteria bacterium SM23_81]|nr:MAG: hypothetical protein AMJ92_03370 [candidate division Zixibacteria bacterium SM23_81]
MSRRDIKYIVLFATILLLLGLSLVSCQRPETSTQTAQIDESKREEGKDILYWTCGMHPSVRVMPEEYKKGQTKCPICNMDLVSVSKGEEAPGEEGQVVLKLSPRAQKLASIATSEVTYRPLLKEIRTVGKIDYDERKWAYVASRVPGRIDKLFVDFTGVTVKQGEPLVWFYSPALVSTQEEYLLALETLVKVKGSHLQEVIENAESLVKSTEKRLLLWGITENQVKELQEKKEAETHMTIYAPMSGTVIHKTALEGKYVKEGENIYHIADLSYVWMFADIYEEDISWIKLGQEVKITSIAYPGDVFTGTISFVNPYLDEKTRSVKIRVDVPNPDEKLKPGMYVDAFIKAPISDRRGIYYTCPMHPEVISAKPGECPECGMYLKKIEGDLVLAVPKSAILDVGTRKLVYIDQSAGRYEAREVKLGPEAELLLQEKSEPFFPVLEGLAEGDKVVARANFLIDSQSQLTGEAAGVYGGAIEVGE